MMGLDLTVQDVAALEDRTEGWIVALQLAALSMQGRDDAAGFIASFADVLRARLLDEQPDQVAVRHRRASDWYEQNGDPAEAIRHATTAGDVERAADLIERAIPEMVMARQEVTVRGWLEALPVEIFAVRPVLSMGFVGALMASGQFEGVEDRLRDAERWVGPTTDGAPRVRSAEMIVVDEDRFRGLATSIAVHRAGMALMAGDSAGTMAHARRALDLVAPDDHLERGAASALLGLAYWTSGDLEDAHRWYADGMASLEQAGHVADMVGCALAVADIQIAQGRLGDAMSTFERALQVASTSPAVVLRGVADMHVGMTELLRERNDLDGARQHLRASIELGEHAGLPQNAYRWQVAMARVQQSEGDFDGAIERLDQAERVYVGDFFPNVRPVAAVRSRVRVAQGEPPRRSLGPVSASSPSMTTSASRASTSTSGSPAPGWPNLHGMTRSGSSIASWRPPKRATGREASSRSSSCRRSLTRSTGTCPPRSSRSNRR